jgi:predicted component of type VI protein secretion system
MNVSPPQLAAHYGVSARTIFRWKARGVDLSNPEAVADHVATLRSPKIATLEAVLSDLVTATDELRKENRVNPVHAAWKAGLSGQPIPTTPHT